MTAVIQEMYFAFIAGFLFLLKAKKKSRIKCRQQCFGRTGPPVVISSKLSLHLQRLFNRSTEKTFSYIAQYLQETNFLQVGDFAHKTKFFSPQGKFRFGYSALLSYTVKLNDGNNEAEHKNIMTITLDGTCFLQR